MAILAFGHTISEHNDLGRFSTGILLEQGDVGLHHTDQIADDFGTTFLKSDRRDELSILAVDRRDGNSDRGWDRSTTGRRVSDVGPDHHSGFVKLIVNLMAHTEGSEGHTAWVTGTK